MSTKITSAALAEAYELGAAAAKAAATWTLNGNQPSDHAARVLALMDAGDDVDARLPSRPSLSGEWADDPTPSSLAIELLGHGASADDEDELASEWERGVDDTFMAACETILRAAVER